MAANGNIRITVRNLSREKKVFTISPNATIMELQMEISRSDFIDTFPRNLRLFKESTRNNMSVDIFDPKKTIAECNINDGEEIYAIIYDINAPPPLFLSNAKAYNPAVNGSLNEHLKRHRYNKFGGKRSRRNRKTRNRKTRNRKH